MILEIGTWEQRWRNEAIEGWDQMCTSLFSCLSFPCFSVLLPNKGNWRKFKDVRPRLRVDLACWPSRPKVSFRAAPKWAFSFIHMASQSLWDGCAQDLGSSERLSDVPSWLTGSSWLTGLPFAGRRPQCVAWQVTDLKCRLKREAFSGPFLSADSAWVRGWGCVHRNRELCSLPAVLGAPGSWQKTFGALHKAAVWSVCCLLLSPWPCLPLFSYVGTCWIHQLEFLHWSLSYLLPCFSVRTSYSPYWFFAAHPFLSFLQFPLWVQAWGISKTFDDQGGHWAGALGAIVGLGG